MKKVYPWDKVQPGEGFFVPTLDVDKVKMEGLLAAVPYRFKVDAWNAIKDGLVGVWFCRRAARTPPA